jgi:hypothetical protein
MTTCHWSAQRNRRVFVLDSPGDPRAPDLQSGRVQRTIDKSAYRPAHRPQFILQDTYGDETTIPTSLLNELDPEELSKVAEWWSSLSHQDQAAIESLLEDGPSLPTVPVDLHDEAEPDVYDDAGDRYEYLVNHELRPIGITLSCGTPILPGVALLAPLWPPYPASSRYSTWELSDDLYAKLEAGFGILLKQPPYI